jgi:peptidoglycan/xylan/chitin deacetylase (PgdA/CDA1 family)
VGQRVSLTFDDGPTELFTPGLLDVLERRGIRATFFVIGALVERHGDLVRRACDAGHEIANHTYDHLSAEVRTAAQVREAVLLGNDCIEKVCGAPPRWLRPPRGEITTATLLAAQEAGLEIALWSVNRGNSPDADSAGVAQHLSTSLRPGSVADLHDGIGRSSWVGHPDPHLITRRRAELDALPTALTAWLDQGYEFDTLSKLIPVTSV